jgi:hypothetical protein
MGKIIGLLFCAFIVFYILYQEIKGIEGGGSDKN